MKKISAFLLGMLLLILIPAAAFSWGLPSENLVPGPLELENGQLLTAENRAFTSRIYTVEEGHITDIYREFRLEKGSETSIDRIGSYAGMPMFARTSQAGRNWEVLRIEEGTPISMYSGSFEDELRITGLTSSGLTVWITALSNTGATYIYKCGDETTLEMVIPPWWLRDVVSSEFDGEVIRATTSDGEHCLMTTDRFKTFVDEEFALAQPELYADGMAWFRCKASTLMAAFLLWLVLAITVLIAFEIFQRGRKLAIRMAAIGGEGLLIAGTAICITAFLLTEKAAGLAEAVSALGWTAAISAGIWLLALVLMILGFARMTAPLGDMAVQMRRIADGNFKPKKTTTSRDELSKMDDSIQELCMDLSIRNYELNATVASYQRFVPLRLTELLDRASISEVNFGDSRRMTGDLGFFSVGNREEARGVLRDDAFVDFINHSYQMLQNCIGGNHGCLLSTGLRLSALEVLFPDSPADGTQAGLDFVGQANRQNMDGIPAPRPFLMLHHTSFLYGVAGQDVRLFPYFSCGEMEFLGSYAKKFYETGSRIIMTEAYWKQLEGSNLSARYIGFVSDGEWGPYKLYELLDAYSDLEKQLRLSYDQRFQEAINLFYHNDFFLARNLFSTLLRVCPEDGIVRWYLFACEYFFNQEGGQEPDYRLFGVSEL